MPEKTTIKRARQAKRSGKSPTTQAGEFVREEIHHVREGKHGARSAKQAIAIGARVAIDHDRRAHDPQAEVRWLSLVIEESESANTAAAQPRHVPHARRG